MSTNTGGPAFPGVEYKQPGGEHGVSVMTIVGGMTLRDYFAAKAMQGFAAAADDTGWRSINHIAEVSYQWADAMMEARK